MYIENHLLKGTFAGRSAKQLHCNKKSSLLEYPDMIGEAIYSKITDSAMPSQIQGEDASMLVQEIENIKDLLEELERVFGEL